MVEQIIDVDRIELVMSLFGAVDQNIRPIEREYKVTIICRDEKLKICGEAEGVLAAQSAVNALLEIAARGEQITQQNVEYVLSLIRDGQQDMLHEACGSLVCVTARGKPIKPKTAGQKSYLEAIERNTVSMGIGPAGTGKTYLAVAKAVVAFRQKQVNKIILTRPAVEAGEKLGFLPGDLQNKVDPYLRPLYDALFDMLGAETFARCQERGNIEVAPLAYMRGRTLDDSFIILDEAQNTTQEQMKMFLTRLGFNSKMVITGDITQIDLPDGKKSGLREAMRVLKDIDGVGQCLLTERDVVRHAMVQKIVLAYAEDEENQARARDEVGEKWKSK